MFSSTFDKMGKTPSNVKSHHIHLHICTSALKVLTLVSKLLSLIDADFVCLFDLILYVPSTIFQLNRERSSWVEPVLR